MQTRIMLKNYLNFFFIGKETSSSCCCVYMQHMGTVAGGRYSFIPMATHIFTTRTMNRNIAVFACVLNIACQVQAHPYMLPLSNLKSDRGLKWKKCNLFPCDFEVSIEELFIFKVRPFWMTSVVSTGKRKVLSNRSCFRY